MSCSNRALDDRGLSFDSRDELFNKVALNIIWQMSAGERYDYADEKMKRCWKRNVDISRIKKSFKKKVSQAHPLHRLLLRAWHQLDVRPSGGIPVAGGNASIQGKD